jgi:hypothetical protein
MISHPCDLKVLDCSRNIQKLLFGCAGGGSWKILQSMQVFRRERKEFKRSTKREGDILMKYELTSTFFSNKLQ